MAFSCRLTSHQDVVGGLVDKPPGIVQLPLLPPAIHPSINQSKQIVHGAVIFIPLNNGQKTRLENDANFNLCRALKLEKSGIVRNENHEPNSAHKHNKK